MREMKRNLKLNCKLLLSAKPHRRLSDLEYYGRSLEDEQDDPNGRNEQGEEEKKGTASDTEREGG